MFEMCNKRGWQKYQIEFLYSRSNLVYSDNGVYYHKNNLNIDKNKLSEIISLIQKELNENNSTFLHLRKIQNKYPATWVGVLNKNISPSFMGRLMNSELINNDIVIDNYVYVKKVEHLDENISMFNILSKFVEEKSIENKYVTISEIIDYCQKQGIKDTKQPIVDCVLKFSYEYNTEVYVHKNALGYCEEFQEDIFALIQKLSETDFEMPIISYEDIIIEFRDFLPTLNDGYDWNIYLLRSALSSDENLEPFKEFIKTINKDWMLIADEVHGLGSENQACALFPTARYRIGLSATPQRWYDEVGTKRLFDYFDKTVIEFDLERAIKGDENGENKVLTAYEYEPILIEFSEEELSVFEDLTHKIGLIAMKKNKTQDDLDKLEKLCRDRARVIGKAENKLPTLIELVRQHKTEIESSGEKYIHNLYYCAPGEHKEVLSGLCNLGIKVHEFVSGVKQRKEILEAFANGDIEGLVAIKCLDEGVDVPATKRAYILASSTNPKEFIQRRGRVLRLSPKTGKYKAYIYDFMIGPWSVDRYNINTAQCLLKRELPRFFEFNSLNNLKYEMQNKIRYACEYFNTINEMDMKPWDVYARIMSEDYTNFM